MDGMIFIIMGKSATGKDTLYKELLLRHPELIPVIPYTTRPIREGETDGEAYHFVTEDELARLESEGLVVEKRVYHTVKGDWTYFTVDDMDEPADDPDAGDDGKAVSGRYDDIGSEDINPVHIMITTLEGFIKIRDYYGSDRVIPIYIEVDDITRIERSLEREKQQEKPCVAEICRRFLADDEDFSEDNLAREGIRHRIINDDLDRAVSEVAEVIRKCCNSMKG